MTVTWGERGCAVAANFRQMGKEADKTPSARSNGWNILICVLTFHVEERHHKQRHGHDLPNRCFVRRGNPAKTMSACVHPPSPYLSLPVAPLPTLHALSLYRSAACHPCRLRRDGFAQRRRYQDGRSKRAAGPRTASACPKLIPCDVVSVVAPEPCARLCPAACSS